MAPNVAEPAPVTDYPVRDARPIVSASPSAAPIIVSGDGEGLIDLATTGALSGNNIILYSGTFAEGSGGAEDGKCSGGARCWW